jgi:hypothetical protein
MLEKMRSRRSPIKGPVFGSAVNYVQLQTSIDLNDPERGFQFGTEADQVKLWFIDWRNRRVILRFRTVYWFSYRRSDTLHGLPEGEAIEILDSEVVRSVRAEGIASPGEVVHHYVISTNEGEWAEVVAAGVDIEHEED